MGSGAEADDGDGEVDVIVLEKDDDTSLDTEEVDGAAMRETLDPPFFRLQLLYHIVE
jgi:hypothetical protein